MHPLCSNSNKKITSYTFNILNNFNENLKYMDGIIDELLMNEKINKNPSFLKFIVQINESRYFSYRCEGYIQCLSLTDFYIPPVLCVLIKDLTFLYNHYKKASKYLDEVKVKYCNEDLDKLLEQMKSSSIFLNSIKELINLYNMNC